MAILDPPEKWHFSDFKMHFGFSGFRGSVGGPGDCNTWGHFGVGLPESLWSHFNSFFASVQSSLQNSITPQIVGMGRPDFQSRVPKTSVVKGFGTTGLKIGAPQNCEIQRGQIQTPILGPLSISQIGYKKISQNSVSGNYFVVISGRVVWKEPLDSLAKALSLNHGSQDGSEVCNQGAGFIMHCAELSPPPPPIPIYPPLPSARRHLSGASGLEYPWGPDGVSLKTFCQEKPETARRQ